MFATGYVRSDALPAGASDRDRDGVFHQRALMLRETNIHVVIYPHPFQYGNRHLRRL